MSMRAPARPDFVVTGVPNGDGTVTLYASKDLTQAQLDAEVDHDDGYSPYRTAVTRATYTLTAVSRTYTIVHAQNYAEAFETLFRTWSPEPDRRGIPAKQTSLPAENRALEG